MGRDEKEIQGKNRVWSEKKRVKPNLLTNNSITPNTNQSLFILLTLSKIRKLYARKVFILTSK
jgi:hypothetical protein